MATQRPGQSPGNKSSAVENYSLVTVIVIGPSQWWYMIQQVPKERRSLNAALSGRLRPERPERTGSGEIEF